MMKRGVVGAAALAVLTALAACGSSDESSDENVDPTPGNIQVVDVTDQPGSVEDYVGALDDAEIKNCSVTGDGLDAAGTVTNPEQDAQDYRIYVSALDGSDTVGLVQVDITGVEGGNTAEWETHMDLNQAELDCVLRVERFPSE